MLALPNPFYKNPEGNARLQLQQQIINETQKNLQLTLMELFSLKAFLSQGHLCYCIPIGSALPFVPPMGMLPVLPHNVPSQEVPQQPVKEKVQHETPNETPVTKETKLQVCLKNEHTKRPSQPKQDECSFKADSVEIVLDLREILPAEITVNVEEKRIRVNTNRVDKEGTKNYWRQYDLPACVNVELAKCVLSHDGYLYICVPWYRME